MLQPTSPHLSSSVYYSGGNLPSTVAKLPPKTNCTLCNCHSSIHSIYWSCPLLKGFICSKCCQEEVPQEVNLTEVNKKVQCSWEELQDTCKNCQKNSFQ